MNKFLLSLIICLFTGQVLCVPVVFAEEDKDKLTALDENGERELTFGELIQAGKVSTDFAKWTDTQRQEFFKNVPPEFQPKFTAKYIELCAVIESYWKQRAELFNTIKPVMPSKPEKKNDNEKQELELKWEQGDFDYLAAFMFRDTIKKVVWIFMGSFQKYPELLDSAGEKEFWNIWSNEVLFVADRNIRQYKQETDYLAGLTKEMQALDKNLTLAKAPYSQYEEFQVMSLVPSDKLAHTLKTHVAERSNAEDEALEPLTDEQKKRLANDEPLFHHPICGYGYLWYFTPPFPAKSFLNEQRAKATIELSETPELDKLAITNADVERWDASLALHPLVRNIASRCKNIDEETKKRLETSVSQASAEDAKGDRILSNTHPALLALIDGKKDLVFSGELPRDKAEYAKQKGVEIITVPIACDAFIFIQNRYNPVRNLTLEQYQGVFSGKYRNWKDVGGFGGIIHPFVRNKESGSEELMQRLVMKNGTIHPDFIPKKSGGMNLVIQEIGSTPEGVAYSIFFFERVMALNPETRPMAVNGVFPTEKTIADGSYPLLFNYCILYRKDATQRVKQIAEYLIDKEGQTLIRSVGYVPSGH